MMKFATSGRPAAPADFADNPVPGAQFGLDASGNFAWQASQLPTVQRSAPAELLVNSAAGGYTTLTADGGAPLHFDATTLTVNEKLEVGIDATETDTTSGVHSELRVNQTYVMVGGVLTLLNGATPLFAPSVVAGNPTIRVDLTGNILSLQGYFEAAGGHDHKYVGQLFIQRVTVS